MSVAAKFTAEVGRLPFAGRHVIGLIARKSIAERRTGPKVAKTVLGLGFMAAMLVVHTNQARWGMNELVYDVNAFANGNDGVRCQAEIVADALYSGANAACTAAQSYLSFRMAKSLYTTLEGPSSAKPYVVGIDEAGSTPRTSLRDGIKPLPGTPRYEREYAFNVRRLGIIVRDVVITYAAQVGYDATVSH